MRRPSVANELRALARREIASRSAEERVAEALALGERVLADYALAGGLETGEAALRLARRRQAGRRRSACLEALLG